MKENFTFHLRQAILIGRNLPMAPLSGNFRGETETNIKFSRFREKKFKICVCVALSSCSTIMVTGPICTSIISTLSSFPNISTIHPLSLSPLLVSYIFSILYLAYMFRVVIFHFYLCISLNSCNSGERQLCRQMAQHSLNHIMHEINTM